MSSARSASILSVFKPKQTSVTPVTLIPLHPTDVQTTSMSTHKASSVNHPQGRISCYTNAEDMCENGLLLESYYYPRAVTEPGGPGPYRGSRAVPGVPGRTGGPGQYRGSRAVPGVRSGWWWASALRRSSAL